MNRLDRETGDTVEGETYHLLERILALAGKAFGPVVINAVGFVTDGRHHSAEEQIALSVTQKLSECSLAHQTVIGMVVDRFHAHRLHKRVEAQCGSALEPSIGLTALTHAVNDVAALVVFNYHLANGIHIVLKVGIDRDCHVAVFNGTRQSGNEGVLMSHVPCQIYAINILVSLVQFADDAPSIVGTAVVYIKNVTVCCNQIILNQTVQHGSKALCCFVKHQLFLVAWHNDCQSMLVHCITIKINSDYHRKLNSHTNKEMIERIYLW